MYVAALKTCQNICFFPLKQFLMSSDLRGRVRCSRPFPLSAQPGTRPNLCRYKSRLSAASHFRDGSLAKGCRLALGLLGHKALTSPPLAWCTSLLLKVSQTGMNGSSRLTNGCKWKMIWRMHCFLVPIPHHAKLATTPWILLLFSKHRVYQRARDREAPKPWWLNPFISEEPPFSKCNILLKFLFNKPCWTHLKEGGELVGFCGRLFKFCCTPRLLGKVRGLTFQTTQKLS